MRIPIRAAIGLFLVILCTGCGGQAARPLPASARQPVAVRLAHAKDLFYAAVAGDHDALLPAERILTDLGGEHAADAQIPAYLGACRLLQASHSDLLWEKVSLARQGLALEDHAVEEAPDDLEVRFLRGVTGYQLPQFLGRHDLAESDLAFVARVAETAAASGRLDRRAAAADLDYHGKALESKYRIPEAIAAWRAAVRIDPNGPGGTDAAKHLAERGAAISPG